MRCSQLDRKVSLARECTGRGSFAAYILPPRYSVRDRQRFLPWNPDGRLSRPLIKFERQRGAQETMKTTLGYRKIFYAS